MQKLTYALVLVAILLAVATLFAYGVKLFNNATTPILVTEVEKGVKCASLVTKDGAALSCWKM